MSTAPRRRTRAARSASAAFGAMAGSVIAAAAAMAQPSTQAPSLFLRMNSEEYAAAPRLEEMSTIYVPPPEPRSFHAHDLITIIIEESSSSSSVQSLTAEREFDVQSNLNSLIDPWELLEGRLRSGNTNNLSLADADSTSSFDGEGESETLNRFTARLTAEIIDVKPNRTLVIQARRVIATDDLTTTLTLTGTIRADDVTEDNTVDSEQIADMELRQEQTGEVRRAARRSIVGRVLETIFSF